MTKGRDWQAKEVCSVKTSWMCPRCRMFACVRANVGVQGMIHHCCTLILVSSTVLAFTIAIFMQCWDLIQKLRAKKNEVNAEFNEKYKEYIKLDKNYNAYIRSVKHKE
eukprot:1138963-Pelagomonas_calceolata.AAC.9